MEIILLAGATLLRFFCAYIFDSFIMVSKYVANSREETSYMIKPLICFIKIGLEKKTGIVKMYMLTYKYLKI